MVSEARRVRVPRAARAGLCALWALCGFMLADATGFVPAGFSESHAGYWLWVVPPLLAAGLVLGRSRWERRARGSWLLIGLALLVYAAGDATWTALFRDEEFSPADVLYLAFYPLLFAGLVGLLRERRLSVPGSVWLDGVIGVLAVLAAAVATLGPQLEALGGGGLEDWVNTAYPLCTAVALAFVVMGCAMSRWRPGVDWLVLGAGLLVMAVSDGGFALDAAFSTTVVGDELLWTGWALAVGLLGTAAWLPGRREAVGDAPGAIVLLLPIALYVLAAGVLIASALVDVPWSAVALAASALLLAALRAVLTLRELRTLPEVRRLAATDELTGLANRRAFLAALEDALEEAEGVAPLCVLLIDLDRFKELNDALGHAAGDRVLQRLAPRLARSVREEDLLARLGGDEFAVLCRGALAADGETVAARLLSALAAPVVVDGLEVVVEASVGQACHPDDGTTADALLRRADVAMYRAKDDGGGLARYDAPQDERRPERLALLAELRRALKHGDGIGIHVQPQVDLVDDRVVGLEALVRWEHPDRGRLLPGDFLVLAEAAGLLRALSHVVVERAAQAAARVRADGHALPLAVNLTASDVVDAGLPADVLAAAARHRLEPDALRVEVTESVVMRHPERAMRTLQALRAAGVAVALDDFGVGQSSLDLLRRVPTDELKIDRGFVAGLPADAHGRAIVRAVVGLGRDLGLRVVAEGVEQPATAAALVEEQARFAQGFLFARPMPVGDLDGWLAQRDRSATPA